MKKFQFRLESLRRWRDLEARMEDAALADLFRQRREIEARLASLDNQKVMLENDLRSGTRLPAIHLAAHEAWRRRLRLDRKEAERRLAAADARIALQQDRLREARRRQKLLERLRDRSLAEWTQQIGRQMDALASELFLNRWEPESARQGEVRPAPGLQKT